MHAISFEPTPVLAGKETLHTEGTNMPPAAIGSIRTFLVIVQKPAW